MKGYRMYQTRPEGGDCTAPYDIDFFESYTVKEFVDDILSNKEEWGWITIHFDKTERTFEYRDGGLKTELPKELLSRTIVFAGASGGWSRMDYHLYL